MSLASDLEELDVLLSEDPEAVRARERDAFEEAAGNGGDALVLFGAGGLGRRTLAGLRHVGIEPLAFTDSAERLWGATVDGLKVLPPPEAARLHGTSATFVVTIWGGRATDRMPDRVGQLRRLGCRRVAPFGLLFWRYPEVFLPYYSIDLPHLVLDQAALVRRAFLLLSDELSRQELLAHLRLRLHLDFAGLPPPATGEIYFPDDLVAGRDDEALVDCGAFDGDTLRRFLLLRSGRFDRIDAFEPDPQSFLRLEAWTRTLDPDIARKLRLHRCAVGASRGETRFDASGTEASSMGSGDAVVEVETLDESLEGATPTYVKMDTEGSELLALEGGRGVLARSAPVMAISAYHLQDHLWKVPIALSEIVPGSRLFLRTHLLEGWDLVCYAVPPLRLVA